MPSPRTIQIVEERDEYLEQGQFEEGEARALFNMQRFEIDAPSFLNGHRYRIRSKGVIGHVPVTESLTIAILPKVPVLRLFGMLEVAYGLKSFAFLEGEAHVATVDDLLDRLAGILAHRVLDRVRRGIYRAYIGRREPIEVVRGRIDVHQSYLRSLRGNVLLECEYEELTADVTENRILLWTLYRVTRLVGRSEVRALVQKAYRALIGEVELTFIHPDQCLGRTYQRLNSDYAPMHGLCRMLLTALGPDIRQGGQSLLPFTLYMPALFEEFVAAWLQQSLDPRWLVKVQHKVRLDSNFQLFHTMDLVVADKSTGRPLIVLDTKYKDVESPAEADINQVIAYAVNTGARRALLVYPTPTTRTFHLRMGRLQIRAMAFDLGKDLAASGKAFLAAIHDELEKCEMDGVT